MPVRACAMRNVTPGSWGWLSAPMYMATLQYGYPLGARTTGRSMPYAGTVTREARGNTRLPHLIDVPDTIRTASIDDQLPCQMRFMLLVAMDRPSVALPRGPVVTAWSRATTLPRLEQELWRISTW